MNFVAFKSVRTFAFIHDKAFRVRTMWNRSEAGDYTIRDGRFVDNGNETRWLERCEGTAVPRV